MIYPDIEVLFKIRIDYEEGKGNCDITDNVANALVLYFPDDVDILEFSGNPACGPYFELTSPDINALLPAAMHIRTTIEEWGGTIT